MMWMLILAVLAAFGVLSICWALFGWFLPACQDGWLLFPGKSGSCSFVGIYLWLRGAGILKCPLVLADFDLSEPEKRFFQDQGIEVCSLSELPDCLGIGADIS